MLHDDLIRHIVSFVSQEAIIVLYGSFAQHFYRSRIETGDYDWACALQFPFARVRALMWLVDAGHLPDGTYVLDSVSAHGNTVLMKKFLALFQTFSFDWRHLYTEHAIDNASAHGQLHMLDWWAFVCSRLQYPFRYSHSAIDQASINGHVSILRWWEEYNQRYTQLHIRFTKAAMDRTRSRPVLDWWLHMHTQYGVELKYSTRFLDRCDNVALMEWWLQAYVAHGVRMKYKMKSINYASASGNMALLNWWFNRASMYRVPLKYSEEAVDWASENGHVEVLDWWLNQWEQHRDRMKYSSNAIDLASARGHLPVLQWWYARHGEGRVLFKRTHEAVDQASFRGHLHILDWWLQLHRKHKVPFLYTSWAIEYALDQPDILQWWAYTCDANCFELRRINWNAYTGLGPY
jgi:hypothetical protein